MLASFHGLMRTRDENYGKLYFCTLFDSHYAAKGWAMYLSLLQVCPSFHLYVFAFDDCIASALKRISAEHMTVISLKEFEDEELLRIKPTRTKAEYCWTCTPSTVLYCLQNYNIDHCTYIDSDLYFFSNPEILVNELGHDDVLITEHRYSPQYDQSVISGKYCVQFMAFKNTDNSLRVLNWWRNACLEWCFNRHEDGRFGDQKYLDDWTTRFTGIHVLENLGGGLAPWNMQQYQFRKERACILGSDVNGQVFKVVFFHFHAFLCFKKGVVREFYAQEYSLSRNARRLLYKPYLRVLKQSHFYFAKGVERIDGLATAANPIPTWWKYIKRIRRRIIHSETRYFYWLGI